MGWMPPAVDMSTTVKHLGVKIQQCDVDQCLIARGLQLLAALAECLGPLAMVRTRHTTVAGALRQDEADSNIRT